MIGSHRVIAGLLICLLADLHSGACRSSHSGAVEPPETEREPVELSLQLDPGGQQEQPPARFEGIFETRNITTTETGGLEEFTMTMWVKPDRVKISTGSAASPTGTTMIYRNDKRVIWMLNTEDRTYAEIEQDAGAPVQTPSVGGGFRVRKTGKKAKILGYLCEQVVITRRDERTELWGSKKLNRLKETLATVLGTDRTATPAEWADEVDKLGFFPLRSTTTIEGRVVEEQEVTRIQEAALAPEIFELPSGYRKQDLDRLLDEGPPR